MRISPRRPIVPDAVRQGSSLIVRHAVNARYLRLRLRVPRGQAGGLWEWRIEGWSVTLASY